MNRRITSGGRRAAVVLLAALLGGSALSAVPAAAVHGAVPGDFNGDGYRDAVLPAPGADVAGKEAAGAVVVLYGSRKGVSATRRAVITQNTAGVPDTAEAFDWFGLTTATADLNRDGYADLLVGTPYEDTARGKDAGSVTVLWGSRGGLTSGTELPAAAAPGMAQWRHGLDISVVRGASAARTEVLVAGWGGAVRVTGPFTRTGGYGTVAAESGDSGIDSVALGDFDGDGSPERVHVTYGQSGQTGGWVYVDPHERDPAAGLPPRLTHGNGHIAATGDVNGDGYDDLVVGDPDEPEVAGVDGALGGRVLVWYGSAAGIADDAVPAQLTQNTAGVPDASEKGDAFGGALTVADLNRDGLADIVIGVPYETVGTKWSAGQVTVIPGRRTDALGTGAYTFTQDTVGVPDASEPGDQFGMTVAVGDVTRDGRPELFIGGTGENAHTGAVWVLPGFPAGPTPARSRVFDAPSVGLPQQTGTALGGNGLGWVI
ncbi:VCBS repeat-containing protein [Streptomyces sp. NPDC006527]|uniref:VCBS repeat-containing protein n=1 Tax=Streptomyces sp. NPDC006527 TaxID=3364749 RepID=UPI0036A81222